MATKIQLIRLEPEEIMFSMEDKEPTVLLKIHNTSEKMIAFKVKTTHPKRYMVRPNQDVIPVDGFSSVKISLQIRDAKQLRQAKITGVKTFDKDCKDNKFLVQCAVVKEGFLEDIEELHQSGNNKALGQKLRDMWGETTRDEFVNKKLTCLFEYPEDVGQLMAVDNVENAAIPFALEVPTSSSKDGSDGGNNSSSSGIDNNVEDIAELRKKYNELINFTVQLTAERDRFKASLKELTKEHQLLKKGSSKHSMRSVDSDADISSATTDVIGGGAFSLWQVMLVAVVAFLMGRLMV